MEWLDAMWLHCYKKGKMNVYDNTSEGANFIINEGVFFLSLLMSLIDAKTVNIWLYVS